MKLFHVSYVDFGPEVKLVPRTPETRSPGEPARPLRVCTASRVGDCLRLFPWTDYRNKAFVYETEVKRLPKASYTLPRKYVPDWMKYGREEIWLLNKTGYIFKKIGYVRMFRIAMMTSRMFWMWKRGGESYDVVDPTLFNQAEKEACIRSEIYRNKEGRKFLWEIRHKRPTNVVDHLVLAGKM